MECGQGEAWRGGPAGRGVARRPGQAEAWRGVQLRLFPPVFLEIVILLFHIRELSRAELELVLALGRSQVVRHELRAALSPLLGARQLGVILGEEFIGVVYRDDEDEDVSYDFHMAILDIDLDEGTDIPLPD